MADDFGYHTDHHGSLVRPPALLAARASGMDAGAGAGGARAAGAGRGGARARHRGPVGVRQVADQPLMSAADQHTKLQLVEMVARYYWGNEI